MTGGVRSVARIAVFSALAYVLALISAPIPNVSFIYIVVFAAGVLFGASTGAAVGIIGEFLWTVFNPYGMAMLPITAAQIAALMIIGVCGGFLHDSAALLKCTRKGYVLFAVWGLVCGLVFQVIVGSAGAYLFGPFWEMLLAGFGFSLLTILSNVVIFPVCYPLVVKLAARERGS